MLRESRAYPCMDTQTFCLLQVLAAGLLIMVALRYRYCSGATFTVAVAPILLTESSGDSSAATFLAAF